MTPRRIAEVLGASRALVATACLTAVCLAAPAAPAGAAPAGGVDLAHLTLATSQVATGFTQPDGIVNAGDGSGRLFIVEQTGRAKVLRGGVVQPLPFLDLHTWIQGGGERGLESILFSPTFATTGRLYVYYTAHGGYDILERLTLRDPATDTPTIVKRKVLIKQKKSGPFHHGGAMAWGPDGYLYVGVGDGGPQNDPYMHAQNKAIILGKILRIDPGDHPGKTPFSGTYTIPKSNPFYKKKGVRKEIWALGLRNPWRLTFDSVTGDLWIGDVGQVRGSRLPEGGLEGRPELRLALLGRQPPRPQGAQGLRERLHVPHRRVQAPIGRVCHRRLRLPRLGLARTVRHVPVRGLGRRVDQRPSPHVTHGGTPREAAGVPGRSDERLDLGVRRRRSAGALLLRLAERRALLDQRDRNAVGSAAATAVPRTGQRRARAARHAAVLRDDHAPRPSLQGLEQCVHVLGSRVPRRDPAYERVPCRDPRLPRIEVEPRGQLADAFVG